MDTDVEVIKPLDEFLKYRAFSGFESETQIPTGIMASEKGHGLFTKLFNEYTGAHFLNPDGTYNKVTNVRRITNTCLKYGFLPNNQRQTVRGFTLFPKDYFCPKDYETQITTVTENTYTIHHFDGSWVGDEEKLALKLYLKYRKYLPDKLARYFSKFVSIKKTKGMKNAVKKLIFWLKK